MSREPPDLIIGRHPVAEALRAEVVLLKLFLAEGMKPSPVLDEIVEAAGRARLPIAFESRASLNRRAGGPNHQGVVAEIPAFRYHTVAGLLEAGVHRLVLIDSVTDPVNLGSIVRSADALGWEGVLVPEHRSVGVTPAVRKVAAGAVERVPIARTGSPAATVALLHNSGFSVVGLEPSAPAGYHETAYDDSLCLVVGAEGPGLSRLVRERCDQLVRIPMRGALASLNAAVSAAIVMAEVSRQLDLRRS